MARLWPDCTEEEHQFELKAMLGGRHPMVADWSAVVVLSEADTELSGYCGSSKAYGGLELMCDVPTDQAELLAKQTASGFEKVQRMVIISKPIDSE